MYKMSYSDPWLRHIMGKICYIDLMIWSAHFCSADLPLHCLEPLRGGHPCVSIHSTRILSTPVVVLWSRNKSFSSFSWVALWHSTLYVHSMFILVFDSWNELYTMNKFSPWTLPKLNHQQWSNQAIVFTLYIHDEFNISMIFMAGL